MFYCNGPRQLLSAVTLGPAQSSNVARAERLQWCAAADICGTRSAVAALLFLPDGICLGGAVHTGNKGRNTTLCAPIMATN